MSSEVIVPVVLDTNILVPSLYRKTPIFEFVLSGNLALIWNNHIYKEAAEIIERLYPKYYKTGITLDEALNFLDIIFDPDFKVSEMPQTWPSPSGDRDDDPFLWAAEQGKAEYIISFDKRHMLKLARFKEVPIGRPRQFFIWANRTHPMKITLPG